MSRISGQTINSTWVGDGSSQTQHNGHWSDSTLWNPQTVPNGNYNVTIPWDPNGQIFNGPELDTNITIQNLTIVNRAFLDNQGFPGTSLTVNGSTSITTSPGHDGETAAVFTTGPWLLGTLTNYDSGTHTLTDGFFFALNGGTIGWRGADVVTNTGGTLIVAGTGKMIDQNNGLNAFRNIAVNNGGFRISDGYNFTTAGNFTNTNTGGVAATTSNGATTVFTVSGSLGNYDSGTHTLNGGYFDVEVTDMPGSAKLRFPGADIRTLSNCEIKLVGNGASIEDSSTGLNALRNLQALQGGRLTNGGTLTITPNGGTFTNDGGFQTIGDGADLTINGDLNVINFGGLRINPPADNANSRLTITGLGLINNGAVDMGGQPGVITQYHAELHVQNGLEFRGAYLTGTGSTFADVAFTQGAVFQPGSSPGQLTFVGNVSLDNTTTTQIQIGGTSPGDQFDQVIQSGGLFTLGGTLDLTVIDGAENSITSFDTFDIIVSAVNLSGSFANVASGDRLYTSDGIGSFIVTYQGQNMVSLSNFAPVLKLTQLASRKTHGSMGAQDLIIPLTGTPKTECRRVNGSLQLIFTFNNNIVSGNASLTTQSGGSISGPPAFSGNTMTVQLTGVNNAQTVKVTLQNVTDAFAQILPNTAVNIGVLLADTTGEGTVNSGDVSQTKSRSGQPLGPANVRQDVNADGTLNSADVSLVKSKSGTSLPPAPPAAKIQARHRVR